VIEVTDEMIYAFAGEPEITATDAHAISVGLAAVLAIIERDQAPTQDAYDAAVRALEKYRTRAAIHADTLLKIHELLDEYRGAKALREGVREAIKQGAEQCNELVARTTETYYSGGDR
jgi:hypothetical protein